MFRFFSRLQQFRRSTHHFLFILATLAAMLSGTRSGYAIDPAVDLAVEAIAAGGAVAGVPVSQAEKDIIKPLAQCIIDGEKVGNCAKKTVISQLPKETQALANCLSNGASVADCAKDEAIRHLPAHSQELAKCVAEGTNVTECGRKFATTEAEKAAFTTVDNLQAGAKDKFGDPIGPIQNIINIVQGIAEEDWEKVIHNGGKAVAKYVVRQVMSTLLTPATAYLAGPITDTVIENRADLIKDLLTALREKNYADLPRILGEAYLTAQFEIACALIPSGAVKEAICGNLGKVIGFVGATGGAAVAGAWGFIEDGFNAFVDGMVATGKAIAGLGGVGFKTAGDFVGGPAGDFLTGIGTLLGGKDKNCGSRGEYYANNMLVCYSKATYLKHNNPAEFENLANSLWNPCFQHFYRCHDKQPSRDVCHALVGMFRDHIQMLNDAMIETADAFARTRRPHLEQNRSRVCSPDFYDSEARLFASSCKNSLKNAYPVDQGLTSNACGGPPKECVGGGFGAGCSVFSSPCQKAADGELKRTTAKVCEGAGKCFMLESATFSHVR